MYHQLLGCLNLGLRSVLKTISRSMDFPGSVGEVLIPFLFTFLHLTYMIQSLHQSQPLVIHTIAIQFYPPVTVKLGV
jgi:hypothetical protein